MQDAEKYWQESLAKNPLLRHAFETGDHTRLSLAAAVRIAWLDGREAGRASMVTEALEQPE